MSQQVTAGKGDPPFLTEGVNARDASQIYTGPLQWVLPLASVLMAMLYQAHMVKRTVSGICI